MKRFSLTLVGTAMFLISFAQLRMGDWKIHFAYNDVTQVEQSDRQVYALSNGLLIAIDKEDGEITEYNKFTGLSGNNICQMAYDKQRKQLVLTYSDGNIDFFRTDETININDWQQKQTTSSKLTNDIAIHNKYAYLATNSGVMIVNLAKKEIADICYIGDEAADVVVTSVTVAQDSVYALSSANTIYKAHLNDNLVDYRNWTMQTNLPGSGTATQIRGLNNSLCLLRNSKLYQRALGTSAWKAVASNATFRRIRIDNDALYAMGAKGVYTISNDFAQTETVAVNTTAADALFDATNKVYWYANNSLGVQKYDAVNNTFDNYKLNGPLVNIPSAMYMFGQKLYVLQGGRDAVQYYRQGIVMIYENGIWTNIPSSVFNSFTGATIRDFMAVAQDNTDPNHFFVTSYGEGVIEVQDNQPITWYNPDNSTLLPAVEDKPYTYCRVDGANMDSKGNLWVLNNGKLANTLNVRTTSGEWVGLNIKDRSGTRLNNFATTGTLLLDKRNENYKWVQVTRATPGLVLFYDGGTPTNPADDYAVYRTSFIDQDGNLLTPTWTYCVVQDANNDIWLGTENGPYIIPSSVDFMTSPNIQRIKIPRNDGTDLADFLLDNEAIRALAVDGANRKWVGTGSSGVYLLSANGQETIKHFTTDNSPLLSNCIISLAINDITGEVFIGTDQGLVSYQSDASEGRTDFDDVYAYPNPVTHDYNGVITVSGLMTNSIIKIIDIAGNLICQTRSNGGIAIWDGNDLWGRRVDTGIYIVQCVSPDGSQKNVTKIMITH